MNNQTVLDVLNELEVIEHQGGETPYILVKNNEETRKKLNDVGVTNEQIFQAGDHESFCIFSLAFNGNFAHAYEPIRGLILWDNQVDDDLHDRV